MNKFKNAQGVWFLQGLFYETTLADKSTVVYTLKDHDHAGYPSLYRLYMESDDLTEYSFAVQYLDGWAHWERLTESSWFKDHASRWRRELEVSHRSRALKALTQAAAGSSKDAFAAQKFLVAGGWKPSGDKRRAGAPSKEEIIQATKQAAEDARSLHEDLQRIRPN